MQDLADVDTNQIKLGDTMWITDTDNKSWSVMQLTRGLVNAISIETDISNFAANGLNLVEITLDKWAVSLFTVGDYVSIRGAQQYTINGLYEIDNINLNKIQLRVPLNSGIQAVTIEDNISFAMSLLRTIRVSDTAGINAATNQDIYDKQRLWIDNYKGDWGVLENNSVYLNSQTITNPSDYDSTDQGFSDSVAVTESNTNVFVSAPNDLNGKVSVYRRTQEQSNLILDQEIILVNDDLFVSTNSAFGKSVAVSPDGEYLIVGIPKASNVKTNLSYKTDASTGASTFDFQPDASYVKNNIVRYRESLWSANREVLPQIANQPFSTFDTYVNLASAADADSTTLNLLVAGDPGLATNTTSHMLVRAPKDMYIGTTAGDTINLFWNQRSFTFPTLDNYIPFEGLIPEITGAFLSQDHTIVEKIDHVMFVETFVSLPVVGSIVTTDTGSAEVAYVGKRLDSAVVYVKNTNGVFNVTGEMFINELDFVGFYSEADTYATSAVLGGFWMINTGFTYSNNSVYYEQGRGLVYADVKLQGSVRAINNYYNIQNTVGTIGTYVTNKNNVSYIEQLSYRGDPSGADAQDGVERDLLSNKWVARVGKTFSDYLTIGETQEFRLYNLDNRIIDVASAGFTYDILNKAQTVADIWDGYIDFTLTEFDFQGFGYEPQVGDTISDVQTPRDGTGGLALTTITTSTAEVMFIKRNFNSIRVYVKVLTGEWTEQSNIGRYQVYREANVGLRGATDIGRTIGTITDINNSIVVGNTLVGKLVVFEHNNNFNIVKL